MQRTKRPELHNLTSGKTYFKQLDGLRCIAILFVLICHWLYYPFLNYIPLGSMGVNIFFVLSGFLITRILLLSKSETGGKSILPSLRKFYIRRFLRIFPIYYLTIIFLLIIGFEGMKENIYWLLTYTFNCLSSCINWTGLSHLWSLNVEEQFYLFFPFIVLLVPLRKMKPFFYGLIIVGVSCRLFLYIINAPSDFTYVLTPSCLDALGTGALLAYYFMYEMNTLENILTKSYLFIGAMALFVIITIYFNLYRKNYIEGRTVLERFLFSIVCFWITGNAALGRFKGFLKYLLENKVAVFIGKISYGIYIYHDFIFSLLTTYIIPYINKHYHIKILNLDPAFTHNNTLLTALLLFSLTLLISCFSWYVIELPINALKKRVK